MAYDKIFDLSGDVALVVGGAGGLGQELCKGFADMGANVVIADMESKKAEEVKEYIESIGQECMLYDINILDENKVAEMVDKIVNKFGSIDILMNAVGTNIWQKAEEYTVENWDKVMDVNLKGTFIVSREVGKQMIKQGGGRIISISSVRSMLGFPENYTAYCAAKGGLNMYTKCLAAEWAKYNIRVNAIAPTFVKTPLTKEMLSDEKTKQSIINRIPLRRLGQPSDLVGAVLYFASDASSFITGQILFIDGGLTSVQ